MSFRRLNQRVLSPLAQGIMIFGIVALCQPWVLILHQYGMTLTLFGLIAFMVTSKIAPEAEPEEDFADEALDVLELNETGTRKDGGIV